MGRCESLCVCLFRVGIFSKSDDIGTVLYMFPSINRTDCMLCLCVCLLLCNVMSSLFFQGPDPREGVSAKKAPRRGVVGGCVSDRLTTVERLQIHELSKLVFSRSHPPFIGSFKGLVNSGP